MKKIIMSLVLFGMFGWAIYEFVFPLGDQQSQEEDGEENEIEIEVNLDDDKTNKAKEAAEKEKEEAEAEAAEREKEEAANAENPEVGLETGNMAPDFQLNTLHGDKAKLSDYRGSRVMINFWATWCPPCRAEMPDMERFYQDTDVEILAVNLTETEPHTDQVQQFVDEYELTFPILLDEIIEVATIYAIQPIPTSFMIDSEGIIQFKTFGPLNYDQMVEVYEDMD
ncbi:redoxin domain-containing protein [Virgibacillus kimchii]